jgi:hypothetical protein
MIEKKRIEEASRNVRQYITDGLLKTRDNESKKLGLGKEIQDEIIARESHQLG